MYSSVFSGFVLSLHVLVLIRLAEIIEKETEAYYKMDPDPFDDRHPGKYLCYLYTCRDE